jgi:uncharacterized membrane protein YjjB (DUF3815 family)
MNMNPWIEIIAAFFGTLGFGFLFNIRGNKLWFAALGGMLAWALFLMLAPVVSNEAMRYFIVSLCTTYGAETMARLLKTPASTFCIIWLLPLVPGGALYYTMTYGLAGEWTLFAEKAIYTVELAAALSLGIVLMTAASRYLPYFHRK